MKKILGIVIIVGLFSYAFLSSTLITNAETIAKFDDNGEPIENNLTIPPINEPKTVTTDTNTTNTNTTNTDTAIGSTMGIKMDQDCLLNGQCKFNIYEFLGIRESISDNDSPELFVQDILLSATFFIGTVVTIALIVSGLMFIFAGASGKDPTTAKAGIKNSLIGLLIVVCSYSIIRVVQYIAKGL